MNDERTIKPNSPADFTPQLGDYKTLQPFRYWCQKVLPLVYDDSLSYYELLCKVVDYLNKTMSDVETLNGDVVNLHKAYEELQSYVNDYFSSLDVQEEINNKLNQMASDGTLLNVIAPTISSETAKWLSDNITTTSPVIDKTLTISGAGADAKVVGDLGLISSDENINDASFDLNNCVPNRIYLISITTLNSPEGTYGGVVWSITRKKEQTDIVVQFYCDVLNNLYTRFKPYGSDWSTWKKYGADNEMFAFYSQNENITDSSFDLNNCVPNRIYLVSTTTVHSPENTYGGVVWSFTKSKTQTDVIAQFYCDTYNNLYSRFKPYANEWSNWKKYGTDNEVYNFMSANTNINDTTFDLNTCTPNRIYIISSTTVNSPDNTYGGILWSFAKSNTEKDTFVQFYYDTYDILYSRFKVYAGDWTKWVRYGQKSVNDYYNLTLFQRVGVVGDSYASGELWKDGTNLGDIYSISWLQQLARLYGFTGFNFSEGGLTTRSWLTSTKGLSLLQSSTACDLVLCCLGINDYYSLGESYLGSPSDIGTNADTFYGNYSKIINSIKTKSNKTRIILFTLANTDNLPLIENFNTAIKNIATHYKIPVGNLNANYYIKSSNYKQMIGGHPTFVNYNGLSTAYSEIIRDVIVDNQSYFNSLYQ